MEDILEKEVKLTTLLKTLSSKGKSFDDGNKAFSKNLLFEN